MTDSRRRPETTGGDGDARDSIHSVYVRRLGHHKESNGEILNTSRPDHLHPGMKD
jgi:hypothetical protein